MLIGRFFALLVLAAINGACAQAETVQNMLADCEASKFLSSTARAEMTDGLMSIAGEVNGRPVRLRLDTGAGMVLTLWRNAADDLGLRHEPAGVVHTMLGPAPLRIADVGLLTIAGLTFRDIEAAITPARTGTGVEGLLGADWLFAFDFVHLQPASPAIAIVDAQGCGPLALLTLFQRHVGLMPGRPHVTVIPVREIQGETGRRLATTLQIGDVELVALIDSGTTVTGVARSALSKLRQHAKPAGTTMATGVDGRTAETELWRFRSVRIGPLTNPTATLQVFEDVTATSKLGIEAVIGADVLLAAPTLISARSGEIYILSFRD